MNTVESSRKRVHFILNFFAKRIRLFLRFFMSTKIFKHEKTQEENEEKNQDEKKLNRLQLEIHRLQQQINKIFVRL